MKKLYVSFIIVFFLIGCSNEAVEPTITESQTLEEQIINVMSENELSNKEIIDYDIKDNFVYVIFKNKHESNTHNPDLVILKNSNGKLEWVAGPEDRTASIGLQEADALIFGRDEAPTVTILLPDKKPEDTNVKGIKVLGESAKSVTYVEELTNDLYMQYMYWIAYTNEEPTHDDFEFITH
ncbi:hypothetical protein [Pseudalkalibacillus salsuginis]|uniref:hypothetical protein n=1 Tax=Pseudalkalibacillus salsuginis TaxID=2910972 RepID=UPI001F3DECCC|nr:hypothetical protein [Pseudalkalibacillus salsuginis]MCF6408324.1 hypothetical protein [Pseudalkalibacillus salsuginis]